MMQLARRISLLVAFCLLTSAATAYAQCAWVMWGGADAAHRENPTKPYPRNWAWVSKGTYPTRHDCYRRMRNATLVRELKGLTDEDLAFGSGGRFWGDNEFLWDGNGVSLTGSLSQWWSCQPEGKKPKGGVLPWE